MTRVALISTGGTIDSLGVDRLDLAHYTEYRHRLPDGELVATLPELTAVAEVDPVPFRRVPSYALTTLDWAELARTVDGLFASGYDGVVITHGTNTLEETAFALHLTTTVEKPVVLVGAMRPANALGADGALNLVRAVQVAASSQAQGVLVVLNDTIHAAPWATKTTTFRPDAFRSTETGPVGYVDADGQVAFLTRPVVPALHFSADALAAMPRVDVLMSHVGVDGALIDAAVAAGARGLVLAGTGAGRCTPDEDVAADRAIAAGVVVCQATRVAGGRVARSPLMARRGLLTAERLSPWKARILLGLGLTRTSDPDTLHTYFSQV